VAANAAGRSGNKNSHDVYSVLSGGCNQRLSRSIFTRKRLLFAHTVPKM